MVEIKKVGVLGCGLMGSGIAQVCATAGFDVISLEIDQRYIEKGFAGIRKSLDKFSAKGTLKEPVDIIFARLKGTTKKEDLAACDIIIEAIIENLDEKRKMFASIDSIVNGGGLYDGIDRRETQDVRLDRFHRKARRHFCEQHFLHLHHRNDDRDQAPGQV